MDKLKPFEVISSRFQISKESAKYYLGRVQKSFRTERPPHQLILRFIDIQGFESLPSPYQLAAMMNENGVWVHTLNAEPRSPLDPEAL